MPTTATPAPEPASEEGFRGRLEAEVRVLRPRGVQDAALAGEILDGLLARAGAPSGPLTAERAGELGIALLEATIDAVGGLEAGPDEADDPVRLETRRLLAELGSLEAELEARRADPHAVAHQSARALLRRALGRRAAGGPR